MKIRTGFVSNSSSSSFICEVCGDAAASGHDGEYNEHVATCQAGHRIFAHFILKNVKPNTFEQKREELEWCVDNSLAMKQFSAEDKKRCKEALLSADIEDLWGKLNREDIEQIFGEDWSEDGVWDYPTYRCPICQFKTISIDSVMSYLLLEKYGCDDIEVARTDIIKRFGTLQTLEQFLKREKNED